MGVLQTFADLINLWPNAGELSRDISVKEVTVRAWKARGIPARYWADVVAAANRRGFVGITIDLLADFASCQRTAKPKTKTRCEARA